MSQSKTNLSVIMPSYNHHQYIGQAIESVLGQTYQDFEFLIVDDCSTDNSAEVILGYNDPRIRTFFSKKRMGAVGALQFLLSRAEGSYIALLNSDDYWHPSKLLEQMIHMEEYPQTDICFTQALMVDRIGQLINEATFDSSNIFLQGNKTRAQWLRYFWDHGNCLCHPSVLAKRDCYTASDLFNAGLRQLPDFDAWVRLVQKHNIYIIQKPLVYHRRFGGKIENTSAQSKENTLRLMNEYTWIMKGMITQIDDREFIDGFSDLFIRKGAQEKIDLACERFFLLSSRHGFGCRLSSVAMWYFFENASDQAFISCMQESYNYSLEDFYRYTGSFDFGDDCYISQEGQRAHLFIMKRLLRWIGRCIMFIMRRK